MHLRLTFQSFSPNYKLLIKLKNPPIDEIFLKQKYLVVGLSSTEIAKLVFSSRPTITRRLKQYGIPLKSRTRRIMVAMFLVIEDLEVGPLR